MTIQQTIGKAMKGGYPFYGEASLGSFEEISINDDRVRARFLDPIFWQALGKGVGWNTNTKFEADGLTLILWKREWHKFIDHLAEGKTPEEFFKSIEG